MGRRRVHGYAQVQQLLARSAQARTWAESRSPMTSPLQISGHGNFGSLDDDPAAAMRYTECRLQASATPCLHGFHSGSSPKAHTRRLGAPGPGRPPHPTNQPTTEQTDHTELNLQALAADMLLSDLGEDCVDWTPTFDASQVCFDAMGCAFLRGVWGELRGRAACAGRPPLLLPRHNEAHCVQRARMHFTTPSADACNPLLHHHPHRTSRWCCRPRCRTC